MNKFQKILVLVTLPILWLWAWHASEQLPPVPANGAMLLGIVAGFVGIWFVIKGKAPK
ncbi:MAG: hypothetical protein PHQ12_07460 [Chthoniobacteraceae bacterium]|nr:hypothetical protein [Chthoniobacteraceae bacterium]